jgi:DNA-binding HxlR family transcriptional regulator
MNDIHDHGNCAVAATAEIIATKWTPLIVHDLSEGPRRFMQLEKACPGISPRTLSERLDMLERQGVLVRRSYPESPPHHRNALEPSRSRQSPRTVPGTVRSVQTL